MKLEPLFDASLPIRIHAAVAIAALALGIWQLAGAKGTMRHRVAGYLWVALMMIIAASSFGIHELGQWRGFSLIHLLSLYVLIAAPLAIHFVRRGNLRRHKLMMIGMFVGALVVAGLFTLVPGRIMHAVVFGT
jgi:uncharacterized membrane protein